MDSRRTLRQLQVFSKSSGQKEFADERPSPLIARHPPSKLHSLWVQKYVVNPRAMRREHTDRSLLTVVMIDSVSTETNKGGDTFTASPAEPLVINGQTVVAKGTKVGGHVETLDEPGRV
jgi:hypothetical protein